MASRRKAIGSSTSRTTHVTHATTSSHGCAGLGVVAVGRRHRGGKRPGNRDPRRRSHCHYLRDRVAALKRKLANKASVLSRAKVAVPPTSSRWRHTTGSTTWRCGWPRRRFGVARPSMLRVATLRFRCPTALGLRRKRSVPQLKSLQAREQPSWASPPRTCRGRASSARAPPLCGFS